MQARQQGRGDMPATHPSIRSIGWRAAQAALAVGTIGMCCAAAQAQSLSGTLGAQITLTDGCLISGGNGATTGLNFGTLIFPSQSASFSGEVQAVATGGSAIGGLTQIVCSPSVTGITVTVNSGQHAAQVDSSIGTGSRAMSNGSSALPYEVYSDGGRTTPYAPNTPVSVSISPAGVPFGLPIFGRVNKVTTNALPSGTYTDQLQVTLSF